MNQQAIDVLHLAPRSRSELQHTVERLEAKLAQKIRAK